MKVRTLRQFLEIAPASIAAFEAAYAELQRMDSKTARFRDEIDWWREVAAYFEYTEAEEQHRRGSALP